MYLYSLISSHPYRNTNFAETIRVRALISSLPAGLPGSSEWILTELYNSCAATDNIEAESDLPLKKIIRDLGESFSLFFLFLTKYSGYTLLYM